MSQVGPLWTASQTSFYSGICEIVKKSEATGNFKAGSKCVQCLQNVLGSNKKCILLSWSEKKNENRWKMDVFIAMFQSKEEKYEAHKEEQHRLET